MKTQDISAFRNLEEKFLEWKKILKNSLYVLSLKMLIFPNFFKKMSATFLKAPAIRQFTQHLGALTGTLSCVVLRKLLLRD